VLPVHDETEPFRITDVLTPAALEMDPRTEVTEDRDDGTDPVRGEADR
jgi:hypothetical protein